MILSKKLNTNINKRFMMQSPTTRDKVLGVSSADKQKQPDIAPVPKPTVVEQEPVQEIVIEPNIDMEKQDIPHHPVNDTSIESTLVRNDEQIGKLNEITNLINTVLKSNPNKDSIANNEAINDDITLTLQTDSSFTQEAKYTDNILKGLLTNVSTIANNVNANITQTEKLAQYWHDDVKRADNLIHEYKQLNKGFW